MGIKVIQFVSSICSYSKSSDNEFHYIHEISFMAKQKYTISMATFLCKQLFSYCYPVAMSCEWLGWMTANASSLQAYWRSQYHPKHFKSTDWRSFSWFLHESSPALIIVISRTADLAYLIPSCLKSRTIIDIMKLQAYRRCSLQIKWPACYMEVILMQLLYCLHSKNNLLGIAEIAKHAMRLLQTAVTVRVRCVVNITTWSVSREPFPISCPKKDFLFYNLILIILGVKHHQQDQHSTVFNSVIITCHIQT